MSDELKTWLGNDKPGAKPSGIRKALITRNELVTLIYAKAKINKQTGFATGFDALHKEVTKVLVGRDSEFAHKYLRARIKKLQKQGVIVPVFSDETTLPRKTKSLEETRAHALSLAGKNAALIRKAMAAAATTDS